MIKISPDSISGFEVYRLIHDWIANIPDGAWPNWVCCWKELNRDKVRSPMQWDTSVNAGFSTANYTWLPVNQNYKHASNVQVQLEDPFSTLRFFKRTLQLRKTFLAFHTNTLIYSFVSYEVFSFWRIPDRESVSSSSFLIAINFSNKSIVADYVNDFMPADVNLNTTYGRIKISSSMTRNEEIVDLKMLHLSPGEALVIQSYAIRTKTRRDFKHALFYIALFALCAVYIVTSRT
ncbi:amino acid transporter heavy chain SLC3A1-like [Amphiura filiformis]|uniref:amino acid transporter heavy chain SLC3A1-like n=1 Tax=Amphiura filiformis TaxID=82378 RepID=UPI003B20E366